MEMSGERLIAADRGAVWAALNDPEVLKACIAGCQDMQKTSPTSFTAIVVQKVGPVKATFTGEIELSDIVEGESYRITGKGKGGAAGGASGGARVHLVDAEGGTRLNYEAEAKVTGKIAQLGARLIDGFAKRMADDFFARLQEQLEGPAAEAEEDAFGEAIDAAGERLGDAGERLEELAERADKASRVVARDMAKAIDEAGDAIRREADGLRQRIAAAEPEKKGFWSRLFGRKD